MRHIVVDIWGLCPRGWCPKSVEYHFFTIFFKAPAVVGFVRGRF